MAKCGQACPYNTLEGCKVKEYNAICPLTNIATPITEYRITNADRIRAMSDEELAVALANSVIDVLLIAHDMSDEQEKVPKYLRDSLTQNYLKWLREPAEGE